MKQVVYCLSCGFRQLLTTGGCVRCGATEAEYADGPLPYEEPPAKVGRNEPCPCGSGKKYKKCCGVNQ